MGGQPGTGGVRAHGPAVQVALTEVAARLAERVVLGVRLDPLRDDAQVERVGDGDRGADERRPVAVGDPVGDLLPPAYTGSGVTAILQHVEAHPDLYRLLITGEGGPAARAVLLTTFTDTATAVFTRAVEQQGSTPRQPMTLVTTAFVGALLHVVERWLDGTLTGTADELALAFLETQAGGLDSSLGLNPGDIVLAAGPQTD